jgi:hypothetical protein
MKNPENPRPLVVQAVHTFPIISIYTFSLSQLTVAPHLFRRWPILLEKNM